MAESVSSYSPKILIIGGGGGAPEIATGIAEALPYAQVDVVQSGADRGGSSREIRDLFDVAAPGDSRNALAAFTDKESGALCNHKYGPQEGLDAVRAHGDRLYEISRAKDPSLDEAWLSLQLDSADDAAAALIRSDYELHGHAYGNMLLAGIARTSGSMNHAIKAAALVLGITENHTVAQTTEHPTDLRLYDYDSNCNEIIVDGEGDIDKYAIQSTSRAHVTLQQPTPINPEFASKIHEADVILLAPGSFMTSVAASLLAEGTPQALSHMKAGAMLIAIANLTEDGVTPSWDIETFVSKLEEYTNPHGTGRQIDGLMVNQDTDGMPDEVSPVMYDAHALGQLKQHRVVIGGKFASHETVIREPHDRVAVRSKVKHNGVELGNALETSGLLYASVRPDFTTAA